MKKKIKKNKVKVENNQQSHNEKVRKFLNSLKKYWCSINRNMEESDLKTLEDFKPKDIFIELRFSDYGLTYYDSYIELINRIAFHPNYYMILPHLLRSLFENLLLDIFSQSLDDSHADLYYQRRDKRVNDFSRLISLLHQLKDQELGPYGGSKITSTTINNLHEIREIGNISIHDIIEKISTTYAEEWKDRIRITLRPLLISYQKLKDKNLQINPERIHEIKQEIGLIKIKKTMNFEKEQKLFNLTSELRSHIDGDLESEIIISEKQKTIIHDKMDQFILKIVALNLTETQHNSIKDAYTLFNSILGYKNSKKSLLRAILDKIIENVLL